MPNPIPSRTKAKQTIPAKYWQFCQTKSYIVRLRSNNSHRNIIGGGTHVNVTLISIETRRRNFREDPSTMTLIIFTRKNSCQTPQYSIHIQVIWTLMQFLCKFPQIMTNNKRHENMDIFDWLLSDFKSVKIKQQYNLHCPQQSVGNVLPTSTM